MFSLFTKKAMNEDAAKSFWSWFEEKEEWIISCIANHDSAFVWAIDERLKPVFPYFKGELEFQLGYNNEVGEFFFFHFGKTHYIRTEFEDLLGIWNRCVFLTVNTLY